jgi:putative hydrolase of the HAD superfamily
MCEFGMKIRAVIFDMGGTLEEVYYDDDLRLGAMPGFRKILARHAIELNLSDAECYAIIKSGMKKYGKWREETEQELPPERVWADFIFVNFKVPEEILAAIGEELAFYWDTQFSKRVLRAEALAALDALRARSFRLGVISNIMSRGMVPHKLDEYGIAWFFQVVLASSVFGYRKPNPKIFLEASRLLGVSPSECAYVGDTLSRDVIGARRAGYGLAIQIKSFLTTVSDEETDIELPDAVIDNLMQVANIVTAESVI